MNKIHVSAISLPKEKQPYYCLWHPDEQRPVYWADPQGNNKVPLLFHDEQLAARYCAEIANHMMKGWMVAKLDPYALNVIMSSYGDRKQYWEYRGNGVYVLISVAALFESMPRFGMNQDELSPEQMALAREAWEKIGHYFDPSWEVFERMALSEGRITYQLKVWLCCARAWEKWFAKHPLSKSDHAKKLIATYVVAISLDKRAVKKPKEWDELVGIYRETAQEMELPPSSPAEMVKVPR